MHSKRSLVRRTTAVAATGAVALVLGACGGSGETPKRHNGHAASSPSAVASPGVGKHNAADVAFAKGMVPHHRQAVEMADLAAWAARTIPRTARRG